MKKLLIALILVFPTSALCQSFDFSCYSADVKSKESGVKKVFFGWSENWDWTSFISYRVDKTKNYSSDIDCAPKPEIGRCVIQDDGAQIEITVYSKSKDKLKMKFPGIPSVTEIDGAGQFKPSVIKGSKPVTLIMKRTNKSFCKY